MLCNEHTHIVFVSVMVPNDFVRNLSDHFNSAFVNLECAFCCCCCCNHNKKPIIQQNNNQQKIANEKIFTFIHNI